MSINFVLYVFAGHLNEQPGSRTIRFYILFNIFMMFLSLFFFADLHAFYDKGDEYEFCFLFRKDINHKWEGMSHVASIIDNNNVIVILIIIK